MSSLAAVAGVTALVGVAAKLKSAFSGAIGIYSQFEKLEVSLSGVMKNLGNTKKVSDDFITSLRKLSNETTFGYDTLAGAAQQMLTVGVSADETKKRIINLGNAAGGSTEKFNRLAEVYTKILATGKADAMQMQQLSMITGTSWVNALGKTSATAKEVTDELEKMTTGTGVLAGAMDRLIDTVEGKQGFVSDVFRELVRNFAEASGIVDAYKAIADVLYEKLQAIADWLVEVNENPFAKALLSGAIATILAVVVTTIGIGLFSALIKVNAQLAITATLANLVKNPILGIVTGITAVATAAGTYALAQKKIKNATKEANEECENQIVKLQELENLARGGDYSGAYTRLAKNATIELEETKKQIEELRKTIKKPNSYSLRIDKSGNSTGGGYYSPEQYKEDTDRLKALQNKATELQENIGFYDKMAKGYATLSKVYSEYEKSMNVDKIAEVEQQIKKITDLINATSFDVFTGKEIPFLDNERMAQAKASLTYLYNLLKKLKNEEKQEDEGPFKKRIDNLQKELDLLNQKKFKMREIELMVQGATEEEAKQIAMLEEQIAAAKEIKEETSDFGNTDIVGQFTETLQKSIEEAFKNDKGLFEGFKNGMQDFTQNVDFASFGIGMLLQAIQQFASAVQNKMAEYDDTGIVMNPFDALADKLGGVIQSFVEFQEVVNNFIMEGIGGILELVGSIFRVIGKFGELFFKLSRMFSTPILLIVKLFSKLATAIGWFADWLDKIFDNWFGWVDDLLGSGEELAQAQEEEAERLRRLNDEYSRLYEAIKEQEEYYLTQKMLLNSQSYNDSITKVNDMILTPRGTFSTSPQDTILAMKHPENLMQNKAMTVTVNNYTEAVVNTEQDSYGNLVVAISRKIANDANNGENGWSDAMQGYNYRQSGKRVSI